VSSRNGLGFLSLIYILSFLHYEFRFILYFQQGVSRNIRRDNHQLSCCSIPQQYFGKLLDQPDRHQHAAYGYIPGIGRLVVMGQDIINRASVLLCGFTMLTDHRRPLRCAHFIRTLTNRCMQNSRPTSSSIQRVQISPRCMYSSTTKPPPVNGGGPNCCKSKNWAF